MLYEFLASSDYRLCLIFDPDVMGGLFRFRLLTFWCTSLSDRVLFSELLYLACYEFAEVPASLPLKSWNLVDVFLLEFGTFE